MRIIFFCFLVTQLFGCATAFKQWELRTPFQMSKFDELIASNLETFSGFGALAQSSNKKLLGRYQLTVENSSQYSTYQLQLQNAKVISDKKVVTDIGCETLKKFNQVLLAPGGKTLIVCTIHKALGTAGDYNSHITIPYLNQKTNKSGKLSFLYRLRREDF